MDQMLVHYFLRSYWNITYILKSRGKRMHILITIIEYDWILTWYIYILLLYSFEPEVFFLARKELRNKLAVVAAKLMSHWGDAEDFGELPHIKYITKHISYDDIDSPQKSQFEANVKRYGDTYVSTKNRLIWRQSVVISCCSWWMAVFPLLTQ